MRSPSSINRLAKQLLKANTVTSAAKTLVDLHKLGGDIELKVVKGGFIVQYAGDDDDLPYGEIVVGYHSPSGLFMVEQSEADSGWGPLLYDKALEYATQQGKGLISDRTSVTPEAQRVWEYYHQHRSDVEHHPIPPEIPDYEDEWGSQDYMNRVYRFK